LSEDSKKLMDKMKPFLELFYDFIDHMKGRKDVKSRVAVLADPDKPETMSILSPSECRFVTESLWASERPQWHGIFNGLGALAIKKLYVNISKRGEGREQSIRFMGALSESKLLSKLGFNVKGEGKEQS